MLQYLHRQGMQLRTGSTFVSVEGTRHVHYGVIEAGSYDTESVYLPGSVQLQPARVLSSTPNSVSFSARRRSHEWKLLLPGASHGQGIHALRRLHVSPTDARPEDLRAAVCLTRNKQRCQTLIAKPMPSQGPMMHEMRCSSITSRATHRREYVDPTDSPQNPLGAIGFRV